MNTHAYFRNLAVINLPNFIFYFSLNLVLFPIISFTALKSHLFKEGTSAFFGLCQDALLTCLPTSPFILYIALYFALSLSRS